MSKSNGKDTEIPKPPRRGRNFEEAKRLAPEWLLYYLATHTKEEVAERLTTYEPGVPHRWFGRQVAPITKEEVLAFWNGGPDIEPRYLDVPQLETVDSAEIKEPK